MTFLLSCTGKGTRVPFYNKKIQRRQRRKKVKVVFTYILAAVSLPLFRHSETLVQTALSFRGLLKNPRSHRAPLRCESNHFRSALTKRPRLKNFLSLAAVVSVWVEILALQSPGRH